MELTYLLMNNFYFVMENVNAVMCTHPSIAERFKMLYKEKCAVEKLCVEKQEVNGQLKVSVAVS